jgi:hypothetical protein
MTFEVVGELRSRQLSFRCIGPRRTFCPKQAKTAELSDVAESVHVASLRTCANKGDGEDDDFEAKLQMEQPARASDRIWLDQIDAPVACCGEDERQGRVCRSDPGR